MTRTYHITELAAMPVHPTAAKFPMMAKSEKDSMGNSVPGPLTRLAEDVADHGVHTPIIIWKGNLLDGRNRLAAAQIAGLDTVPTMEYTGDSPVSYIISLNVERRHLDKSQLAVLAVELEQDFAEEAAARHGTRTDLISSSGDEVVFEPAIAVSAKAVGVSEGLANNAKSLKNNAPDLYEKVVDGRASVSNAYDTYRQTYVNPDGDRIIKPVFKEAKPTSVDALLDKADRAYDSFMDVIEEMKGAGATIENFMPVINMLNNLLKQAIKTQEAL